MTLQSSIKAAGQRSPSMNENRFSQDKFLLQCFN